MAGSPDRSPAAGAPSERSAIRRHPERGHYDRRTIYAILDEAFICHVGLVNASGPVVLPMAYARVGDALYLHGAAGNAMLRSLLEGAPVCLTVTIVDGLVLAASAFHHSLNYRSVVVFGAAEEVRDRDELAAALAAIVEHLVPGRSADARWPNDAELAATRVIRVALDEVSAKVRSGDPVDEPADLGLGIWAGQIPLRLVAEAPVEAAATPCPVSPPRYVTHYARPAGRV